MAKAGDLVMLGHDLCLLYIADSGNLHNIRLTNSMNKTDVGIEGFLHDKDLINQTPICSLTDILTKIKINE
jgi:hypothetical protein